MADDELFEDLEDFSDLDEVPEFDLGEGDVSIPDFAEAGEGEGLSRTFKIVGGLIALAVVGIVALLVWFALSGGGDELTVSEKTSTAVVQTNVAIQSQYDATLTALALIDAATQTAVREAELEATAQAIARQTQDAVATLNAGSTATAEFFANQTLVAAQTATQDALNAAQTATQDALSAALTATAEANTLVGRLIDPQGVARGGVTLRLYRDDGDGIFNPSDRVATPVPAAGVPASAAAQTLSYGEAGQGTLAANGSSSWTFSGAAGDVVTIDAVAAEAGSLDLFLELVGPGGNVLLGDDDSGEETNPRIADFELPQDGDYTIRVSSVVGAGDYTLFLSQAAPTGGVSAVPAAGDGIALAAYTRPGPGMARAQEEPTPIPGDVLIDIITTATDGTFDFGVLEPGIYWLELDYDTLPPELKALVAPGQPLVIMVNVPVEGEITFQIGVEPTPTPIPPTETPVPTGLSPFDQTATARAEQIGTGTPQTVTVTTTPEAGVTVVTVSATPEALPTTGFFSDLGDKAGGIEGTGGLTVLAIAAAGLVAVVVIARKLRTSA